ncbi:hypothetical protein WA1_39895 [Scytonema hofmannii PCC 7110]|uniref:Uncharacterized protein n=1 Tax=Scytonema hofmannii PCC 7110 TaxID=128403 RepID=A0A139WYX3_9CYAN|nr:hypothetical protein [Scytonema hofmannii]KYC37628.1 hypothetical protein WA1_39895 [Scytonema hofmannii PCC 7110]
MLYLANGGCDHRVLQLSAEVTKPLEPGRLMHDYSFTGVAGQQIFYDGMFTDGATVGTDTVTARLISPSGKGSEYQLFKKPS